MYKKVILIFVLSTQFLFAENYFLTLRNEKTNLRQGPSFDYPIKIFYKKKFLPVLIKDKSGNFRKVIDHENNTGWIHRSMLSSKKAALVSKNKSLIFKRPTAFSKPLIILEKGRLCLIIKCKNDWCKIKVDKYKGWIKKDSLWGKI